jgi:hypothetical protein
MLASVKHSNFSRGKKSFSTLGTDLNNFCQKSFFFVETFLFPICFVERDQTRSEIYFDPVLF